MQIVPPPKKVLIQPLALSLNLVDGLRAEKSTYDICKCGWCNKVIKEGGVIVWVSNSINKNDSIKVMIEKSRHSACNGAGHGICLKCAPKNKISWFKSWFK